MSQWREDTMTRCTRLQVLLLYDTVARRRDDGTNGSRMFSFIYLFPRTSSNYGFIIFYAVFSGGL